MKKKSRSNKVDVVQDHLCIYIYKYMHLSTQQVQPVFYNYISMYLKCSNLFYAKLFYLILKSCTNSKKRHVKKSINPYFSVFTLCLHLLKYLLVVEPMLRLDAIQYPHITDFYVYTKLYPSS